MSSSPSIQADATSSHPPAHKPDPTILNTNNTTSSTTTTSADNNDASQRGLSSTGASAASKLASAQMRLRGALRQFPDFPSPGILFEDILPIFANPSTHEDLISALELHVASAYPTKPDVIVGLDARGFLFGPSLALRLGAAFVPVRKQGKLPGPCETASYEKEYGQDFFQMQADAIKPGQNVLIVDDIIATGGSASAAGSLVKSLGGSLVGYVFILELDFLKGRAKLDAPVYTLLSSQEAKQ